MILALGAFDGFHRGHKALLSAAARLGAERGEPWSYLRLYPHPATWLAPGFHPLFTEDEKDQLDKMLNLPEPCRLHFDRETRRAQASDFLELLRVRFDAVSFVSGYDFRFGWNREGDLRMLQQFAAHQGGVFVEVPQVNYRGRRVSSTLVRQLLARGCVREAGDFLGQPWFVAGTVTRGFGRGKEIGFPTVNLSLPADKAMPAFGVYASQVLIENRWVPGATSWGINSTFGSDAPAFETTLIGFEDDLYGQKLTVALTHWLRPMATFPGKKALRARLKFDTQSALKIFNCLQL